MSEQLKVIQDIRREIQGAKGDVENVAKSLVSLLQESRQLQGTFKFDSPQGAQNSLKANAAIIQELNDKLKEQDKINASLQKQIERLSNVRRQSNKRTAEEIENTKILSRNAREFAKIQSNLTSEYEKLSVSTTKLKRRYKDLAVQQAQGNELTEDQVLELQKLEKQILKNVNVLKTTDERVGEFNRNVGNYKSGFDGLGFSIAQLTREAPAFANSMQTGFMAISNNIPMLVDEINKLRAANKALAAEGKPTVNVLRQIGRSLFGWQTLISIGVTLLTLYGKELIEMAFGASEAEKAQKKLNEAMSGAQAEARNSTQEYRALRDIVQDTTNSELARSEALEDIKEKIPELKDVTLELMDANDGINDANTLFIKLTDDYIKAVTARAKANAFANLAAEAEAEIIKRRAASLEDESAWYDYMTSSLMNFGNTTGVVQELVDKAQKRREEGLEGEQASLDLLNAKYEEYLKLALELESGLDGLNGGSDNVNDSVNKQISLLDQLKAQYERIELDATTAFLVGAMKAEDYRKVLEAVAFVQNELAKGVDEGLFDIDPLDQLVTPEDAELAAEILSYLERTKDVLNEIGEQTPWQDQLIQAQQFVNEVGNLFNTLSQRNIQRIEDEIAANDLKYAEILASEELTLEQRAALEAEAERKRLELEKKRREEQRKQAIINKAFRASEVISNTAVAVSKALADGGFILGIPQASVVGALGAVQLATVLAQPIPQFKDGVENFAGGLAIVGDGGKQEPITDRAGKLLGISPDKPTLVNLPKGSNVYSSVADPGFINHVIGIDLSNGSRSLNQAAQAQSAGIETAIKEALSKVTNPVIHNHQKGIDYSRLAKELSKINKLESI